jgi:hypothetical protein
MSEDREVLTRHAAEIPPDPYAGMGERDREDERQMEAWEHGD